MIFLAPFAALLLQLFLSRTREYAADETGVKMVGDAQGLISALQKLGAYNKRIPTSAISPSTSSLCIVKPFFGQGTLSSLFSTHPPLEDRIAVLRQTGGNRWLENPELVRAFLVDRLGKDRRNADGGCNGGDR